MRKEKIASHVHVVEQNVKQSSIVWDSYINVLRLEYLPFMVVSPNIQNMINSTIRTNVCRVLFLWMLLQSTCLGPRRMVSPTSFSRDKDSGKSA
jgi:hypothetical protein